MIYVQENDYSLDYTLFLYNEAIEQEKFNNEINRIFDESGFVT